MGILAIVAANVKPKTGAVLIDGLIRSNVEITAGQAVWLNPDGYIRTRLITSPTDDVPLQFGIAVNGAYMEQPITYQVGGEIQLGSVLVTGHVYGIEGTEGGISDNPHHGASLGVAISNKRLLLAPQEVVRRKTEL